MSVTLRGGGGGGEGEGGGWTRKENNSLRQDIQAMKNRFRFMESSLDEAHQRLRKGTIIVSSNTYINKKGQQFESLFSDIRPKKPTDDEYSTTPHKDNQDLEKILELINLKYGVSILNG